MVSGVRGGDKISTGGDDGGGDDGGGDGGGGVGGHELVLVVLVVICIL